MKQLYIYAIVGIVIVAAIGTYWFLSESGVLAPPAENIGNSTQAALSLSELGSGLGGLSEDLKDIENDIT